MRIHTYQIADLLLGIEADEKYLHTELQAFETIDSTEPQILIRLIPSGSPLQYSGSLLIHSELLDIMIITHVIILYTGRKPPVSLAIF